MGCVDEGEKAKFHCMDNWCTEKKKETRLNAKDKLLKNTLKIFKSLD